MAHAAHAVPASSDSSEELDFLRRRLALFGAVSASLGVLYWVVKAAMALRTGDLEALRGPVFGYHALGTAAFALIWLGSRSRRPRSRRYLLALELVGMMSACTAFAAMSLSLQTLGTASFVLLLVFTYAFMLRAILVPTTPRTTAFLTALAGVPLVVFDHHRLAEQLPFLDLLISSRSEGMAFARENFARDAAELVVAQTFFTAMWWLLTTTLATTTSRVIYGLRREVRAAQRLGQYTLKELLGEGGMGRVYRAEHALLRRPTALKLLLPERAGETNLQRFEREVQLTAKLTHPNTVTIYDYGHTVDGIFYYAMELLDGCDLEVLVQIDGAQRPARVRHVLQQIAGALAEAHGIGLIHRDIKPANIILCERGGACDVAKIVDFGLVKALRDVAGPAVTQENMLTGTPLYLSPESIRAPDSIDGRSDLYSLGAVAYFLLTGQHVFTGANTVEVCSHHLHTAPVPPSERLQAQRAASPGRAEGGRDPQLGPTLPAGLEALVLECLAKDPADRPGSARELCARLEALDDVPRWTQEDGQRWWAAHGARARARASIAASESVRTLAVEPRLKR